MAQMTPNAEITFENEVIIYAHIDGQGRIIIPRPQREGLGAVSGTLLYLLIKKVK